MPSVSDGGFFDQIRKEQEAERLRIEKEANKLLGRILKIIDTGNPGIFITLLFLSVDVQGAFDHYTIRFSALTQDGTTMVFQFRKKDVLELMRLGTTTLASEGFRKDPVHLYLVESV